jgi:hypothetical protein
MVHQSMGNDLKVAGELYIKRCGDSVGGFPFVLTLHNLL